MSYSAGRSIEEHRQALGQKRHIFIKLPDVVFQVRTRPKELGTVERISGGSEENGSKKGIQIWIASPFISNGALINPIVDVSLEFLHKRGVRSRPREVPSGLALQIVEASPVRNITPKKRLPTHTRVVSICKINNPSREP